MGLLVPLSGLKGGRYSIDQEAGGVRGYPNLSDTSLVGAKDFPRHSGCTSHLGNVR